MSIHPAPTAPTAAGAAPDATCWTLVLDAAAGAADARARFAHIYLPVVRACLRARWSRGAIAADVEDAMQETFVECFREGGALGRVERTRGDRFRTFLFAVTLNVARRFEERRARDRARRADNPPLAGAVAAPPPLEEIAADAEGASRAFDRAWAAALLRRAAERQEAAARAAGGDALRRVELLRLRFAEDRPIREIARLWNADPAHLHREYARAREEFKRALRDEVAFQHPNPPADLDAECTALLELLA